MMTIYLKRLNLSMVLVLKRLKKPVYLKNGMYEEVKKDFIKCLVKL